MMAKVAAFAKAFAGHWRIVEMDVWDNDILDLAAHLTFEGAAGGEIAFGALKGFLGVRYGARDDAACAEFSWEGYDDIAPDHAARFGSAIEKQNNLIGHEGASRRPLSSPQSATGS